VILAVDDNSLVRATIVSQLANLGYKVLEATDVRDALKLLVKHPTPPPNPRCSRRRGFAIVNNEAREGNFAPYR
jgi:CheY-like chemotaxis protein